LGKWIRAREVKNQLFQILERLSRRKRRRLTVSSGKSAAATGISEGLSRLKEAPSPPGRGLLTAVGALADIEELDAIMADIAQQRRRATDREVELE
jgi:hypothetical protein